MLIKEVKKKRFTRITESGRRTNAYFSFSLNSLSLFSYITLALTLHCLVDLVTLMCYLQIVCKVKIAFKGLSIVNQLHYQTDLRPFNGKGIKTTLYRNLVCLFVIVLKFLRYSNDIILDQSMDNSDYNAPGTFAQNQTYIHNIQS